MQFISLGARVVPSGQWVAFHNMLICWRFGGGMEELVSHTDASSISRFSRNSSVSLCSRGAPSFSSFSLAGKEQTNRQNSDNFSNWQPIKQTRSGDYRKSVLRWPARRSSRLSWGSSCWCWSFGGLPRSRHLHLQGSGRRVSVAEEENSRAEI